MTPEGSRLAILVTAGPLLIGVVGMGVASGCTPKIPDPPPPSEIEPAPAPSSSDGRGDHPDTADRAVESAPGDGGRRVGANAPGDRLDAVEVHHSDVLAQETLAPPEWASAPQLEFLLLASGEASGPEGDDDEYLVDPEGHDQWRGATLAVRAKGDANAFPWLSLRLDAFAVNYSLHVASVLEAPALIDVRVNTHNGEDNWSTSVDAYLLRSPAFDELPAIIWQGSESYDGVLDICVTMNGLAYQVQGDRVFAERWTEQTYSPSEPGDRERVPADSCRPQPKKVVAREAVWPVNDARRATSPDPAERGR